MTSVSFGRVKAVLAEVRAAAPHARDELLVRLCGDDAGLTDEVRSLLHIGEEQATFLEGPAAEAVCLLEAVAPDAHDAPVGMPERIGRYRVVGRLGAGGMGAVFEAEQDHPRRRVALKMVRPGLITTEILKRFRREAELLGRLHHPGIAQIYDAGMVDLGSGDQPWFAMELVKGEPITAHADAQGLDTRGRLELFVAVCDAVHHAHQQGVVHRDLKPDNILVVPVDPRGTGIDRQVRAAGGQPKVLDFGVGRAIDAGDQLVTLQTNTGQLIGTLPYMSPEQVGGATEAIDGRSDVYALGVLLFELLAGHLPHQLSGRSLPEAARIIREDDPERLHSVATHYRGDLDTIVGKALQKEPDRRYASAAELGEDVLRYLHDEPIAARPASTFYQLRKFARRHRALAAGTTIAFVALLVGLIVSIDFALDEAAQRGLAEQREADARFATYQANLTAAAASNNPVASLESLALTPEEHRGWAYAHLLADASPLLAELNVADVGAPGAIAFPAEGSPLHLRAEPHGLVLTALGAGEERTVAPSPGLVSHLALAEDGVHLAALTAEGDTTAGLHVWRLGVDTQPAERLLELRLPHAAAGLSLSPRGARVAVDLGPDGLTVLDVADGSVHLTTEHGDLGGMFTFHPDGEQVVLAVKRQAAMLASPDGVRQLNPIGSHAALAVSPAGDLVAMPAAEGIQLVGVEGGVTSTWGGSARIPSSLAFTLDGRHLAAVTISDTIDLWRVDEGALVRTFGRPAGSLPQQDALTVAPDGSSLLERTPSGARWWALESRATHVLAGHTRYVYEAVFSPDGTLLASAGGGGEVLLWDVASGELLARLPCGIGAVHQLAFTDDGRGLLAATGIYEQRWDPAVGAASSTGRTERPVVVSGGWPFRRFPDFWETTGPVSRETLRPGFRQCRVATDGGTTQLHGRPGGFELRDTARGVTVLAKDPDASLDVGTDPAVALSADGSMVATGHSTGVIQLWDARTGELLRALPGHHGVVYSLAFDPTATRLGSTGRDGTLRLWHVERGERVLTLEGHEDYAHSVSFSPDGSMIATSSGDSTVRLWDAMAPAERFARVQDDAARRADWRSRLVARLDQLDGDAQALADELRADDGLDDLDRSAALRELLALNSER